LKVEEIKSVDRWPSIVSSAALLRASDAISNQRALGVAFFVNCSTSTFDLVRFSIFAGQAEAMMKLASSFDADVRMLINELYTQSGLEQNVTGLVSIIYAPDFPSQCLALPHTVTRQWESTMEFYIQHVVDNIRANYVITNIVQVNTFHLNDFLYVPVVCQRITYCHSFQQHASVRDVNSRSHWLIDLVNGFLRTKQ
jgi:hypothetical protein